MNGQTLAHVRRILTDSDRALIDAVTDAGHDQKIEVPAEAVRGIESDREFVLMLSWSLMALPRAAQPAPPARTPEPTPATTAPATTPAAAPANAVDAEFMALMARTRRAPEPTVASHPQTPAGTSPEQQIAALLGLAPRRPG